MSDPECVGWFNENLKNIRDTVRFLGEMCRQYDTPDNRQIFKSYQKHYRQAIIDSKRTYNDVLVQSSKNPTKCMWNIINSRRGKTMSGQGATIVG